LEVANKNAEKLAVEVEFFHLDFLQSSTWPSLGLFDLVLSNPPYIPRKESLLMPDHVLDYEPDVALFVADEDPLIFYRQILAFCQEHLRKPGALFLEINQYLGEEVVDLLKASGMFREVVLQKDLSGNDRMVIAKK
jgi:release factor glutamine methyltransferase